MPIVFPETRALAQEWTLRFLGAAARERRDEAGAAARMAELAVASPPEDA